MTVVIGNGLYAQALEPIARVRAIVDARREPSSDEVAAISRGFFEAGQRLSGLQGLADLTVGVQRPGEAAVTTGFGSDPSRFFAYIFPGLAIFGLLFIAQALAMRLMRDRLRGLQRRLMVTPTPPAAVILGGVLYLVVALFALLVFLALVGAVVFRIRLRDPVSLLAIGVGFAIFAAGLHLLSNSLARSDRTAGFAGSVVVMVLSLLGGSFVPAEQYPPVLRGLAALVPNGAAQQGFIDVLVHEIPLPGLGARLAVTWVWGLATLGLAVLLERRRARS
jgi:ABC-type multidrug transport system permease subunit